MKITQVAKKGVDVFKKITTPLDWLEFAAFLVVAVVIVVLIPSALIVAMVDGLREQDLEKISFSLIPLVLLGYGAVRFVITRKFNWILVAFTAIVSGVAFYLLYI